MVMGCRDAGAGFPFAAVRQRLAAFGNGCCYDPGDTSEGLARPAAHIA